MSKSTDKEQSNDVIEMGYRFFGSILCVRFSHGIPENITDVLRRYGFKYVNNVLCVWYKECNDTVIVENLMNTEIIPTLQEVGRDVVPNSQVKINGKTYILSPTDIRYCDYDVVLKSWAKTDYFFMTEIVCEDKDGELTLVVRRNKGMYIPMDVYNIVTKTYGWHNPFSGVWKLSPDADLLTHYKGLIYTLTLPGYRLSEKSSAYIKCYIEGSTHQRIAEHFGITVDDLFDFIEDYEMTVNDLLSKSKTRAIGVQVGNVNSVIEEQNDAVEPQNDVVDLQSDISDTETEYTGINTISCTEDDYCLEENDEDVCVDDDEIEDNLEADTETWAVAKGDIAADIEDEGAWAIARECEESAVIGIEKAPEVVKPLVNVHTVTGGMFADIESLLYPTKSHKGTGVEETEDVVVSNLDIQESLADTSTDDIKVESEEITEVTKSTIQEYEHIIGIIPNCTFVPCTDYYQSK